MAFSHLAQCVKIGLADFPSPFLFTDFDLFRFRSISCETHIAKKRDRERERERVWSFHNPLSLVLLFTPRSAICEVEKIQ